MDAEFESAPFATASPTAGTSSFALSESQQIVADAIVGARQLVHRASPLLQRIAPAAARAAAGTLTLRALSADRLHERLREASDVDAMLFFAEPSGVGLDDDTLAEEEAEFSPAALSRLLALRGGDVSATEELAEALLAQAASAKSDAEAMAFAGGLTITIASGAPAPVLRVLPVITRGTCGLVRILRAEPATRALVPLAGSIVKGTIRDLWRRARTGRPVTSAHAQGLMARRTARTLRRPRLMSGALARNMVVRSRFNRRAVARAER
jgi:hypothetical protein